jgi:putative DNA-invertase from lambdoid prophage Rac
MAHYGYVRVSTTDQTTENQKMEIAGAGFNIEKFFSDDGVSGTKEAFSRPAFAEMLSVMKAGDVLVVTKVDRLGRRVLDTAKTVQALKDMGIGVKVIQFGGMDITSTAGKFMFTMLSACAEMERDMLIERTRSGLARTKSQGTKLGPPLTIEPVVMEKLIQGKAEGLSLDKLSELYGVPRNTIHRNVKEWAGKEEEYAQEWAARQQQYAAKAV